MPISDGIPKSPKSQRLGSQSGAIADQAPQHSKLLKGNSVGDTAREQTTRNRLLKIGSAGSSKEMSDLHKHNFGIEPDTLKEGDKLYKTSWGSEWVTTGQTTDDWSGCYLATKQDTAEGYAYDGEISENGNNTELATPRTKTLWEVKLKSDLKVLRTEGVYYEKSSIKQGLKAKKLKEDAKGFKEDAKSQHIDIGDPNGRLIEELGRKGMGYLGPASEGAEPGDCELIVSWDKVNEVLDLDSVKKIKEYTLDAHGIVTDEKDL